MSQWHCLIVSADGVSDWRLVEAESRSEVVTRLSADGVVPLEVRAGGATLMSILQRPIRLRSILSLSDQSLLLTQLALLVRAGLPVDRSLDLLCDQAPTARQRSALRQAAERVRQGGSLAAALEQLDCFPAYVIGVVRSADRSGKLDEALASVAERLTLASATRQQLITALTYPAAVLAATMAALAIVVTQVIPQFAPIFEGEEARLPELTQIVLTLSAAINNHIGWVLVGISAFTLTGYALVRASAGSPAARRWRRLAPWTDLVDQYAAGQFMGLLATLLSNGVSIVNALPLIRQTLGADIWREHIADVERRVREGWRLSAALATASLVPVTAIRLIEVGERTGKLSVTCLEASQIITSASRARLNRLVSVANPVAIVTLGGLVGLLVAGVMLGIFALGDFAG